MSLITEVIFTILCLAIPAAHADDRKGDFHEINRFHLGGDGGWDYLTIDSDARRIYIARGEHVMVINADTGKSVGDVQGLDGAHGIALVKALNQGFATSGKSGEVIVFDLQTLKTVDRIKAGENPDAIVYNQASNRVFAFNGKSRSITAIDPQSRKSVATIPLDGKPEFAVSNDSARVFFNLEDKNELLEFNAEALQIAATHSLVPCEEPTGLSMDRKTKRLIVGCGNKLAAVFDANSGKVAQTFKVGDGVDATAFDSERKLAFVSAGEGILTILSEDEHGFRLLQNVPTVRSARTLAVDEKTGRIFLPIARLQPTPSASASGQAHVRPSVIPDTFELLVVGEGRGKNGP